MAAALCLVVAACGSGSPQLSKHRLAELRLERTDLATAAAELRALERPLHREVDAARAAWPLIDRGVTRGVTGRTVTAVARATQAAEAIVVPPQFGSEASTMTGPASAISMLFHNFDSLSMRGWQMTQQAVEGAGSPASTRFLRANAGVYIQAIFAGQYNLTLIGKDLRDAYQQLGGPGAFGSQLTQQRVAQVAGFYSPAGMGLPRLPAPLPN